MAVVTFIFMGLMSLVSGQSAAVSEQKINEEWSLFKITYNKVYATPEEESHRREIFIENRAKIQSSNEEYEQGRRSFKQLMNHYGDMLFNEFNKAVNGFNLSLAATATAQPSSFFVPPVNVIYPDHFDWRDVGGVTRVRDQGSCQSCYAYSAAGALEGQQFRKTGRLVELSAQNILDCSRSHGNEGCDGGLLVPAWEYVKNNGGLDLEEAYPDEKRENQCRFRPEAVGAICTGYVSIAEGDEKGLEAAVATIGPVSAAIQITQAYQFLGQGVYYDPTCSKDPADLNHAILIIGYGCLENGQKYWLIKNSYGPTWGEGGYFKLARDADNNCGIASYASYPLV